MSTVTVPTWWLFLSGLYFLLSLGWTVALTVIVVKVLKTVLPLIEEGRTQVRRVSNQAKSVAAKASNTADIVHAQTQNLLGNAQSAGTQVTQQARTVGAALTGVLVAARVINFVRKAL